MKIELHIKLVLPDDGLTPEQQKLFGEYVAKDLKALNYELTKGVLGSAYDHAIGKSTKKIITPYESVNIVQ